MIAQSSPLETGRPGMLECFAMQKSDVICPECGAGYRRIELPSRPGAKGEFRCLTCDHTLELFDGSREVANRFETISVDNVFGQSPDNVTLRTCTDVAFLS